MESFLKIPYFYPAFAGFLSKSNIFRNQIINKTASKPKPPIKNQLVAKPKREITSIPVFALKICAHENAMEYKAK